MRKNCCENPNFHCGSNFICELNTETGVLTISGSGDFDESINCNSSIKSIVIKNGITSIGNSAFENCSSLTSITIPNSVTKIGNYAFYGCSSLTSITIPDSVTIIEESTFTGCRSLTSITISDSVTSIERYAFLGCISLTSITIPDSVKKIGESAFSGCSSLTSIIFPNSVTKIGGGAFYGCSSLTSITIPDSVTEIGESAFEGCSSLKSIAIPNSVKSIDRYTFYGCSSLTSITIPYSVIEIKSYAFFGCISLTSIAIPDSVTEIGESAFYGCNSLTSITIPYSVTEIKIRVFDDCNSLNSIIVDKENTKYSSIDGVLFNKDGTILIKYPSGNTKTSYVVPDSVISISAYAFFSCTSITSITIPNSVTIINDYAFNDCSFLKSITIPNSVNRIGSSTFSGCSSLTSITVDNENSYYSSIDGVLFNKDGTRLINYPSSNTEASYVIPSSVNEIGNYAFEDCSYLTSITVEDGNTNYSFIDGVLFNKDGTKLIKYPSGNTETSYVIPNSVTNIESYAFYGSSSLTSITVGDGNTNYSSIDGVLFSKDGTRLIKYPSGNTETSYVIPGSVTEIDKYAFNDCRSLISLIIPKSVTEIYYRAFKGCISLENVIFEGKEEPKSTHIRDVFSNVNIKKIIVPVDYIGYTFCGINVEKLKFPKYSTAPGYYVNKADSDTYIKCTNSECETIQKPTEQEFCTSNNDGKLMYDGSAVVLCTKINELITKSDGSYEVKEDHYTVIPFATTEANYLVHHAINGEVFNFDRTSSNVYYVVKSNENAIVFNPEISKKDHCADKDGKLMDRVTDFCSDNSSGMYYTCVNGKCTSEYQTKIGQFENNGEKECTCIGTTAGENCAINKNAAGYYLYESNLYEYKSGENRCTKVDEPADGYYWNDYQYNQLVECINGSCKAFTPKWKGDARYTFNSDLLVDTGYNINFDGESLSSMLLKQSNENYQYKISSYPNTAFADPEIKYSIKVDKNSVIIDSEPTIDDPNANVEPGFYKITGNNKYKQCDSTGCNEVTLETECKTSTIGKLFTKDEQVALCLNFFDNKPIWTYATTTGKYFLKYHANNNIFGLSNGQYSLIKITQNTITLSKESKVIHYRYTTGDQKVLTENSCVASKINEFKIVEGKTNVYTLSCTEKDETGLCKKL